MSATAITMSVGTAFATNTVNSPSEANTRLTTMKSSFDDAFNVAAATGHTHNGVDSAFIAGDNGEGINAIQSTGSAFAIGTFVYITGRSGVNYTVAKAQAIDPSNTSLYAQYVVTVALASGTAGAVFKRARITTQVTTGGTIGRPFWLSATAGEFSITLPTSGVGTQILGYVEAVSATVGILNVDIKGPIPWSLADQV